MFQNVSRGATTWSPLLLVHPPVPSSDCLSVYKPVCAFVGHAFFTII